MMDARQAVAAKGSSLLGPDASPQVQGIGEFTQMFLPKLNLGLRVEEPDAKTAWFNKPRVRIGRSQDNDMVLLEAAGVSRFHAAVLSQKNGCIFSDLGSKNGSWINGQRVSTAVDLQTGATLQVGSAKIAVDFRNSEARFDRSSST